MLMFFKPEIENIEYISKFVEPSINQTFSEGIIVSKPNVFWALLSSPNLSSRSVPLWSIRVSVSLGLKKFYRLFHRCLSNLISFSQQLFCFYHHFFRMSFIPCGRRYVGLFWFRGKWFFWSQLPSVTHFTFSSVSIVLAVIYFKMKFLQHTWEVSSKSNNYIKQKMHRNVFCPQFYMQKKTNAIQGFELLDSFFAGGQQEKTRNDLL